MKIKYFKTPSSVNYLNSSSRIILFITILTANSISASEHWSAADDFGCNQYFLYINEERCQNRISYVCAVTEPIANIKSNQNHAESFQNLCLLKKHQCLTKQSKWEIRLVLMKLKFLITGYRWLHKGPCDIQRSVHMRKMRNNASLCFSNVSTLIHFIIAIASYCIRRKL